MEDQKRRRDLREERAREWRTRRRDPGDLVTWSVVLGGFLIVLLFMSAAYDGRTWLGAAIVLLLVGWLLVVWVIGGVNVVSVLWGRSVSDTFSPEREPLVLAASGIVALVAIAFPLADVASSLEFGWYGRISGAIGVVYLVMVAIDRRNRTL